MTVKAPDSPIYFKIYRFNPGETRKPYLSVYPVSSKCKGPMILDKLN
jgi:succinate dehydrogenase/fumarate reductase-like Fe-S protein